MKKIIIAAVTLPVILLMNLMAASGCNPMSEIVDELNELASVEVTGYEGKNLSSINDFRENSIRGPQRVGIESYQLRVSGLVENPKNYSYEEVINNH